MWAYRGYSIRKDAEGLFRVGIYHKAKNPEEQDIEGMVYASLDLAHDAIDTRRRNLVAMGLPPVHGA